MTTRIVLVRHGESMAQEQGFLGGHDGCKGLSSRGRGQAEALRDRLAVSGELAGAVALYASVMPRAIETAQIIAPAVGGLEVQTDCSFCEGHPGEADGMTWAELAERSPAPGTWDPDHRPVPGWETWAELGQRVSPAMDDLLERHDGGLVVVACHGGVIAHSMMRWLALERSDGVPRAWFAPANTSLTEWRAAPNPYRPADAGLQLELVRFNDHAHLSGRPELRSALM